jgi:2,3-bisphosphoglycerate-dependent phosphoglycerate mutase
MELLLIRHGLPIRIEDAGAPADPDLSDEGWEQARRLAAWHGQDDIHAVYASPLRRARQTAQPLADALGMEVVVDDELAEFDRDAHFYIPYEELKATKDERFLDLLAGRWGEDAEVDPATFQKVVVTAVERVIEAHPSQRVAVVCHGGVLNAYLAHVLGIGATLFFEPHYTGVSRVLAARSGERSILSLNEIGHLEGTRR